MVAEGPVRHTLHSRRLVRSRGEVPGPELRTVAGGDLEVATCGDTTVAI